MRLHGETHQRPVERFAEEKPHLLPLPSQPFDAALIKTVRASNQFRVSFEANRYSVPAAYASTRVTLKVYPDRLCLYDGDTLIARHPRCYDRHQDIEDPDHPRALIAQRRNAREHQLLARFLRLCPQAEPYYQHLLEHRLNASHHVHKILALSEVYGVEAVAQALQDALAFEAYSSEYIANLLQSRVRLRPEPAPLQVPRAGDALLLEVPEPDLSIYEPKEITS